MNNFHQDSLVEFKEWCKSSESDFCLDVDKSNLHYIQSGMFRLGKPERVWPISDDTFHSIDMVVSLRPQHNIKMEVGIAVRVAFDCLMVEKESSVIATVTKYEGSTMVRDMFNALVLSGMLKELMSQWCCTTVDENPEKCEYNTYDEFVASLTVEQRECVNKYNEFQGLTALLNDINIEMGEHCFV